MAKLLSETIDAVDPGPLEAAKATGSMHLPAVRTSVMPQVLPNYVAYALYIFEINIRASVVLGLVGAGGIGRVLEAQRRVLSIRSRDRHRRSDLPNRVCDRTSQRRVAQETRMSHPMLLEPDETSTSERLEAPIGPKVFRAVITVAIVVPAIWSAVGLNVSLDRLIGAPNDVWGIVKQMKPDLGAEAIQRALPKVMESVFIAWVGTMIGAFFSFPLAFFAAKNVTPPSVNTGIRQLLNGIRAVPELVVAIFLIPGTGLGAWTGTLALGLHSIGTLGKLSSEVIEGIDEGPVEAVASAGGGQIARMRFAVVPQVMPTIVAYWLYRFEINIRASAVLGVVGAGGIGAELVAQPEVPDSSIGRGRCCSSLC